MIGGFGVAGGGVAFMAHIGGFAIGVATGLALCLSFVRSASPAVHSTDTHLPHEEA